MRSTVTSITTTLHGTGLSLAKAVPRGKDHLLVELTRNGAAFAGQWFADEVRAQHVHDRTRAAADDEVRLLGDHLLLQPSGADRRLRAVRPLLQAPGSTLVAHRPEQRAVVRRVDGTGTVTYLKAVRPTRLERALTGLRLEPSGVETPRLVELDSQRGLATMTEVPGQTLFSLLGETGRPEAYVTGAARRLGTMLAKLHRHAAAGLPRHDAGSELAVIERWQHLALTHGVAADVHPDAAAMARHAGELLAGAAEPVALVHRDLHDKQLLLSPQRTGVLDFDLASAGEPALDLANLLVHMQLRAHQNWCSPQRARAVARAVLEGYGPISGRRRTRIGGYAAATAARLAYVYAFRPVSTAAAAALVTTPGGPIPDLEEWNR